MEHGYRPMISYLAGCLLVTIGILQLVIAPLAQSCLVWSDGMACETIGTVVLNVSGVVCLVAGMAVLSVQAIVSWRHKISV